MVYRFKWIKTTIAESLSKKLLALEKRVLILDGDAVRSTITTKLGFLKKILRQII